MLASQQRHQPEARLLRQGLDRWIFTPPSGLINVTRSFLREASGLWMSWLAQIDARDAKLSRAALRARMNTCLGISTNPGYAMIGAPFFHDLAKGGQIGMWSYAWAMVGMCTLAAVVFLAPRTAD